MLVKIIKAISLKLLYILNGSVIITSNKNCIKNGKKMLLIVSFLLAIVVAMFIFWKFVFLRNPDRSIPSTKDSVISPADGKIIEILEFNSDTVTLYKGDKRYRGLIKTMTSDVAKQGYIISIFMSPLDVHYNRSPVNGTITKVTHSKGKFLPVNTFEAGLVNEKSEIIIDNSKIKIKMIQIAGFLARRVITYVKANDKVNAGEVIGLINLGSQVTLIMPKSVIINVVKGDRVVAGETILAKINS